jgi:hypothetical protein
MEMFSGGQLEHKVMQKTGCMDYSSTEWELVNRNIYQRQINYKFDKALSRSGGEASTTQQKYALVNQDGWAIEEVMTLQGVLLGDYFNVRNLFHICSSMVWYVFQLLWRVSNHSEQLLMIALTLN